MPYAFSDGARIFYRDTQTDGHTLLLAHGMFMDSRMFARQIETLASVCRVISWDARGHGKTTSNGRDFTYWDAAGDALAVLDEVGVEQAVVGGMSQGGFTALRLALLAPHRVSGLILIGTEAGCPSDKQVVEYGHLFSAWFGSEPLLPLARNLAPGLIGGDPSTDQQPWIDTWLASDREALRTASKCLLDRDDVNSRLAEITVPALVVRGASDYSISREATNMMAAGLPGCSGVLEIDDAGHAVNWTHPAPVNAAILNFLAALSTTPAENDERR